MQDRCSGLWRGLAEKLLDRTLGAVPSFPQRQTRTSQDRGAEPSFPGRQNGLSQADQDQGRPSDQDHTDRVAEPSLLQSVATNP